MVIMTKKRKFKFDKLIRDNIPKICKAEDIDLNYRTLNSGEHINALKDKLVEEATEILNAKTKDEIAEEIADVLEVIDALKKVANISEDEILKQKDDKLNFKGSYYDGIYGNYVNIDSNHELTAYYLSEKDRYPEID